MAFRALEQLMSHRRTVILFCLILGLTLVQGILYASIVPPWQTPDEPKHFEYVALLEQKGRLVTREDASPALQQEIISSMKTYGYWKFGFAKNPEEATSSFIDIWSLNPTQLHRPPLYYLGASVFYRMSFGLPIEARLFTARLFSVLLGLATILMLFLTVRTVFPDDPPLALLASGFAAFLPTHSFVMGSVNSDNLANLVAAILAFVLARAFFMGASLPNVVVTVLLLFAGLWTKRTTLFMLPLAALSAPIYMGSKRLRRLSLLKLLWIVGLLTLIMAFLALFKRSRDGLGWILENYVLNGPLSLNIYFYQRNDYSLGSLLDLYVGFTGRMFDSFWAQFGWMNIRLDDSWYLLLLVFTLLSVAGLARYALRLVHGTTDLDIRQKKMLLTYVAWIAMVVAIPMIQYTADFNPASFPQGRYLFPALVPIATLFSIGVKSLFPTRYQAASSFVAIACLVLLNALSLMLYIVPSYY